MTNSPTACTDIWLVRHGSRQDVETPEWIETAARPHDSPLAENGWIQARETGAWLARETDARHLLASPFLRTVQTASCISEALGLPIKIEAGLAELFLEKWFPFHPNLPDAATVARDYPAMDATSTSFVEPQYPEDDAAVVERTQRTMAAITQQLSGTVVCVSHGGAIAHLCKALVGPIGGSVHPRLCSLIHLQHADGAWHLRRDGHDGSHLSITEETLRIF